MVILLGLAAAMLYGTGDFLGGLAARKVQVLAVLMLAETAGVIVALPAAVISPGPARLAGLAWGISAGLIGRTVDTSPDTGATTLIGPAARPV